MDVINQKTAELETISSLIIALRGKRTNRELARDAKVSPGSLSKYINKQVKISPDTIRLLTAPEAKPQNGITCEELMLAAGYITASSEQPPKPDIVFDNRDMKDDNHNERLLKRMQLYQNYLSAQKAKQEEVKCADAIISYVLRENGFIIKKNYLKIESGLFYIPDFSFTLQNNAHINGKNLCFTIINDEMVHKNLNTVKPLLANILFVKPNENRRITLVTFKEENYDMLHSLKGSIAYKGDITIILIDKEKMKIRKEEYICFFDKKTEREKFYITNSRRRKTSNTKTDEC